MAKEEKILYLFDGFCLDGTNRCLWRGENMISLTPKALETLLVLIQHSGEVIEKTFLMEAIWANSYVEDATLAQNISTLRKAFGLYSDKQFIETVPRRGYRFVAEVETADPDDVFVGIESNWNAGQEADLRELDYPKNSDAAPRRSLILRAIGKSAEAADQNKQNVKSTRKFFAAGIFVFIVLAGIVIMKFAIRSSDAESKFTKVRYTKLTTSGNVVHSSVSPDGKYLAMVEQHGGGWGLSVRQISSDNELEILRPGPSDFFGVTFSPDSQSIYYGIYPKSIQQQGKAPIGVLYKIPLLGGVPEEIISKINSPIAISPNNREFVFLRQSYSENQSMLIVANFADKTERLLASHPLNKPFSFSGPAWSPDGKTISCPAYNSGSDADLMELLTIDVKTGEQKSLVSQQFKWIGQHTWLKDGSGVIFPGFFSDSRNLMDEVWIASFPDGKVRQVTNGTTAFRGISLTSGSNSFVTIKSTINSKHWVQDIKPTLKEPQVINPGGFSELSFVPQGLAWTPDKKILFGSTKNNNSDIWLMNTDGSNQKQLTSNPAADYAPEISPDGKYMFFLSNRSGISNLWRTDLNKNEVKPLTNLPVNIFPGFSANEKFVYYVHREGEDFFPSLWRISIDGSEPVRLTDKATTYPRISPDGKLIACFYDDQNSEYGTKLSILSAENGALIKQFDASSERAMASVFWSSDEKSIFYLKNSGGVSTIFEQPVDADAPNKIIESKNDTIFRFALSADGNTIVYQSGSFIQDVIVAESVEE